MPRTAFFQQRVEHYVNQGHIRPVAELKSLIDVDNRFRDPEELIDDGYELQRTDKY